MAIRKIPDGLRFVLFVSLGFSIGIIPFHPTVRVFAPALLGFSLAAGAAISTFFARGGAIRIVTAAVMIAGIMCNASILVAHNQKFFDPLMVVLGWERQETYLARMHEPYDVYAWVNAHVSTDARILTVCEESVFYCQRAIVANSDLDPQELIALVERHATAEGVYQALVGAGFTHLVMHGSRCPEWPDVGHAKYKQR